MKLLVLASLATSAAAFTAPTMTFAVGKKGAPKKAAATKPVAAAMAIAMKVAAAPKAAAAKAKPVAKAAVAKAAAVKKAVVKAAPKPVPKPAPKPVVMAAAKPAPKPVPVMKAAPKPAPKPAPVMKAVAKPAPAPKIVARSSAAVGTVASTAIPGETAPAILDGSLPGDVGFDPCYLSTRADTMAGYFNGIFGGKAALSGLSWYREAELMHGRICMLAVLGFIIPGFTHFAGNDWTGVDAYAETNPLAAISSAPSAAIFQVFAFMSWMEFRRINIIIKDGSKYQPGDSQKWGQGPGRWNPLGLNYSPEEYKVKQLQEVKHARLAMIGLLGLIFQANASGVNVVDQLSAAFISPDYYTKAGYYFPDGI